MREKIFDHLILTGIVGICGMGVSSIRDMSQSLQVLTISVQELNSKMSTAFDTMKDHEQRIRFMEKDKSKK